MKKAEIFRCLDNYQNLESRVDFLENLLKVNGVEDCTTTILSSATIKERCKSCYGKSELARFFYILMDEGFLFFDSVDKNNNRSKFQQFVISNFSYAGDHGAQINIESISKQFSESKGFYYREKQIKFLEDFILRMQHRKNRLENW